jgi:hypothetical protein
MNAQNKVCFEILPGERALRLLAHVCVVLDSKLRLTRAGLFSGCRACCLPSLRLSMLHPRLQFLLLVLSRVVRTRVSSRAGSLKTVGGKFNEKTVVSPEVVFSECC